MCIQHAGRRAIIKRGKILPHHVALDLHNIGLPRSGDGAYARMEARIPGYCDPQGPSRQERNDPRTATPERKTLARSHDFFDQVTSLPKNIVHRRFGRSAKVE
jgi:hypothetical protein